MWEDAYIGLSFALPSQDKFARLGLTVKEELHGGFQSRVVRATDHDGLTERDLAVKLIDTTGRDANIAVARMRVVDQAAHRDDRVVPLVSLAGRKLNRIDDLLVVASPYIEGEQPDVAKRSDVERMARALARLHESLRLVQGDVPVHHALLTGDPTEELRQNSQLLHGDYAPGNLLVDRNGMLWIFDFDDCGYGPVEFEVGNTLFMVLFDTSASLNQPSVEYEHFRKWFVGAYQDASKLRLIDKLIDVAIQTRAAALRHWLTNLDTAPVGIRNSTPDWQQQLRAFAGTITP